jgi:hypothetical protein
VKREALLLAAEWVEDAADPDAPEDAVGRALARALRVCVEDADLDLADELVAALGGER